MTEIKFDPSLGGTQEQQEVVCKRLRGYKQTLILWTICAVVLGVLFTVLWHGWVFLEMAAVCVLACAYVLFVRMRNEKKYPIVILPVHCIDKKRAGYRRQNIRYVFVVSGDETEKETFEVTVSRNQLFTKDGDYTIAFFKLPQEAIDKGASPYSEKNIVCKI